MTHDYSQTKCSKRIEICCDLCDEVIYTCDGCGGYFHDDSVLFCDESSNHYHEKCIPEEVTK
jgi:hypothetical protein